MDHAAAVVRVPRRQLAEVAQRDARDFPHHEELPAVVRLARPVEHRAAALRGTLEDRGRDEGERDRDAAGDRDDALAHGRKAAYRFPAMGKVLVPLGAFVAARLLLVAAGRKAGFDPFDPVLWAKWDSGHYLSIARDGYQLVECW